MTEGTAGEPNTSTASTESSASLADDLGAMFGDFSGSESPETSSDQGSGAPPDSDDSALDPAQLFADGSEGEGQAAHAGTPPAVAAGSAPDTQSTQGQPPLDDPLKDATPFTYTVNGQQRTADGIKRLGDHGAIVDAEYLPKLERIFTERDHLFEKSREEFEKRTALEKQYETLTAWQTRDAQGNTQTLTGPQGLEAQRTLLARTLATLNVYSQALQDPEQLVGLLGQDQSGQFVLHPQGVTYLKTLADNAAMRAETQARTHFSKLSAPQPAAPPPEVPVEQLALSTVEQVAQQLNATGLTAEDKQFLAAQLPRYVRATTPEEKQLGHGSRIVDHAFTVLVQREAQRIANTSRIATTATATAQENAARLAAAAIGKRPTTARPTTPTPTQRPVPQSETNRADMWDRMEKAQAGVSRRSA